MRRRFARPSTGIAAGAFAGLLSLTLPLTAPDFRPVHDTFPVSTTEPSRVRGDTGTARPAGEAAAGPRRLASARLRGTVRTAGGIESDSAAVVGTVDRFHAALAAGDSAAVADLLALDAIILESGGIETREEYLGGHLHGDIAFARAVPRERGPVRAVLAGDVAWATSTTIARGEFRGREVRSAGAELMVLRRTAEGWRIVAIHWSSRSLSS